MAAFRRPSEDVPAIRRPFRDRSESQGPCSSGQGQKPGHAEVSRGTSTAVTGTFAAIPVRSRIAPQRQYQRVADAERRIAGWVARPGSLWTGCGPASGVAYIDCCCLHTVACDRTVLIPDPRVACVHALRVRTGRSRTHRTSLVQAPDRSSCSRCLLPLACGVAHLPADLVNRLGWLALAHRSRTW